MARLVIGARDRYDSLFHFYGARYGVFWVLLKAQAVAESNLDPNAVSPVGARGLTQFLPATWAEWWDRVYGVRGLPMTADAWRNPERAIELQAAYMHSLVEMFGTEELALAAYNWGMGHLRRHLRRHGKLDLARIPRETREYLRRIRDLRLDLQTEVVG